MSLRTAAIVALLISVAPALSIAANLKPATMSASGQAKSPDGIAWYDGDIDAAFAYAKAHDKPLFLYWGAAWCPPCNQVKATIFNRQDFIERSGFFVPVHIDGDAPGAQKLGDRFKVRAYPTMILFKSDGKEITRLPGEVDADRYLKTLTLGLNANHPVKETLAAALAGKKLSADEWRLLAFYSWETDEQQLVGSSDLLPTLQRLAKIAPAGDTATRLALSVLVAAANQKPEPVSFDKAAASKQLMGVLATPRIARDNMDLLVNYPAEIVGFVAPPKSAPRAALVLAFDKAMQVLDADRRLSKKLIACRRWRRKCHWRASTYRKGPCLRACCSK
ncbi:thioredoxin family protein [Undibacterium arcticum]